MEKKLIRGIRAHDIMAEGLPAAVERAKELGIEGLQLVLERKVTDFKQGSFSEEYAKSIKEDLDGLSVPVLGSYINPSAPDDNDLEAEVERFKEKIRFASIIKPTVVGTETGIYKEGETESEEAYRRVLGTLRALAEYAKEYNVCIGVEGVHFFVINSPKKMQRLIEDIGTDNVRVIYDPMNLITPQNYKNQDDIICEMFDLLGDKIVAIHVKDFVVENGEMRMVPVGEGMLNYKLIFEKMNEKNLNIPMILEETKDDKAQAAFEYLESL